jgi:AraC family transcriptional regulator
MNTLKSGTYSGEILNTCSKDGVTACVTKYSTKQFEQYLHCHENAHLSFMLEGGCIEKKKDKYEITPGSITYYSAGEEHQVVDVAKPSKRVNVELEQGLLGLLNISEDEVRMAIKNNPDTKFLLVKVQQELNANDFLSGLSIQMLMLQLVGPARLWSKESNKPSWVETLNDFLRNAPEEQLTLKKLSLVTDLHPVTLSKQFPKYFNCTIAEFKRKLKIEKALSLIHSTELSLTEVALECGFYDQSHFTRTFKQQLDILPSQYKSDNFS